MQFLRGWSAISSPCWPTGARQNILLILLQGDLAGNLAGILRDFLGATAKGLRIREIWSFFPKKNS